MHCRTKTFGGLEVPTLVVGIEYSNSKFVLNSGFGKIIICRTCVYAESKELTADFKNSFSPDVQFLVPNPLVRND